MEVLFIHIPEKEEECLVIGGDYNARTSNKENYRRRGRRREARNQKLVR